MGLELVEIGMNVEETFGILLPDSQMPEIRTVGDLHDCIVKTLGQEIEGEALAGGVDEKLRTALKSTEKRTTGLESVHPETTLSVLFPFLGRRKAWRKLQQLLGLHLPPLQRPHWLSTILLVIGIALGWMSSWWLVWVLYPPGTKPQHIWQMVILIMSLGFLAIFFWWFVAWCVTTPLAAFWPNSLRNYGDLAQQLLDKNYGKIVKKEQRFNSEEVWDVLRRIVANVLGINPNIVTRNARFVEDLGVG